MSKSKARSVDTELAGAAGGEPETPKKKQKTVASNETEKPGRFKVVGHLVMAMKRFQAALNPTIGPPAKRTPDTAAERLANERTKVQVQPKNASGRTSSQQRSTSGRTISGRPIGPPGHQHGNKGNILLRPLPVLEN